MTIKAHTKITDVKVIRFKELEFVGSIELTWDEGGLMHFSKGGGSFTEGYTDEEIVGIGPGIEIDPAYTQ